MRTSKAGVSFAQNYTPARHPVQTFKAAVVASGLMEVREPFDGPLRLRLQFLMPRPKAMTWKRKPMPTVPHTSAPDIDNLCKAVMDAMNGIAWADDSQVMHLHAEKWYAAGGEETGVCVSIEGVE